MVSLIQSKQYGVHVNLTQTRQECTCSVARLTRAGDEEVWIYNWSSFIVTPSITAPAQPQNSRLPRGVANQCVCGHPASFTVVHFQDTSGVKGQKGPQAESYRNPFGCRFVYFTDTLSPLASMVLFRAA